MEGRDSACRSRMRATSIAGFRAAEIRNRAIVASSGALLRFSRRRLHSATGFRRAASRARGARLVRRGQSHPAVRSADRRRARAEARAGAMEPRVAAARRRGINRLAPALRLPLGPLRKAAAEALGRRAHLQSRGRARRSRPRRRVRRELQRLGAGGFRSRDPAHPCGVRRKDGRFATGVFHLWHRENDRARIVRQSGAARRGDARRSRARAARALHARRAPMPESVPVDRLALWQPRARRARPLRARAHARHAEQLARPAPRHPVSPHRDDAARTRRARHRTVGHAAAALSRSAMAARRTRCSRRRCST